MKIAGYSERGMINALFYDIARAADPSATLDALLAEAAFPQAMVPVPAGGRFEVLLEQSFSDFGDADALLLIEDGVKQEAGTGTAGRGSVFVEAKVKTCQRGVWRIADEFDRFVRGMDTTVHSSNLFTQLYHKQRLVEELRSCGLSGLQAGISFPSCSSKLVRKLGSNAVVHRAAKRLQTHLEPTGQALYLALVPGSQAEVSDFFASTLPAVSRSCPISPWDTSAFGWLTWGQVESFCRRAGLHHAEAVFAFNQGQIY